MTIVGHRASPVIVRQGPVAVIELLGQRTQRSVASGLWRQECPRMKLEARSCQSKARDDSDKSDCLGPCYAGEAGARAAGILTEAAE